MIIANKNTSLDIIGEKILKYSEETENSTSYGSDFFIREEDRKKVKEKVNVFSKIRIFTHKDPDGDAIGSMLALEKILVLQGKEVEMFVFDSVPERFNFLPGLSNIKTARTFSPDESFLSVFVDCSFPQRTGFDEALFLKSDTFAIDHHLLSLEGKKFFGIVDSRASSAAEIIFHLAEGLKWKTDRDISLCLLAGILSDTGTFQHSNTSVRVLNIVSRLLQSGINLKKLSENLFQKKEADGALKIWGLILSRVSVDKRTGMAFSYVFEEDLKKYETSEDELGGLVNLLAGIPESKFSLLLSENKFGKTKASLRSESYKGIDVAEIARSFGGGGHKLAAGFEVEGKILDNLEMIKEKIAKEIKID